MDAIPKGLIEQAREKVLAVPGVEEAPRIRMRRIGGDWFSDVVIRVQPGLNAERAHKIADEVESAQKPLMPDGDVVVHVEPRGDA